MMLGERFSGLARILIFIEILAFSCLYAGCDQGDDRGSISLDGSGNVCSG